MTLSYGLACHLWDKNIWAHVLWAIVNSEGHNGQIMTQFLEKAHDEDKEHGFFQQEGATAHTRQ
jgi:hypothetical protein